MLLFLFLTVVGTGVAVLVAVVTFVRRRQPPVTGPEADYDDRPPPPAR
jgi:hypothetical protein